MSVADVRQGLAANLAAIPEIQISAYVLSNPTPPTVWVARVDVEFDRAFGSRTSGQRYTDQYTATLQGFVPLNEDIGNQATLDLLLSSSGVYSVKRAVEADKTLGGACDDLWVSTASFIGLSTFLTTSVLLAEWSVTIVATEVAL